MRPLQWATLKHEAGLSELAPGSVLTPEMRRAAELLVELGNAYGISKHQRRIYFAFLVRNPDQLPALETVLGIMSLAESDTTARIARSGLEYLDEMLAEYHAKKLARALKWLVIRGCNAIEIAETLNDTGLDERFNGRQPFGEFQVRRACKKLGLKPRPVRWR